jgi:hypothetical protein
MEAKRPAAIKADAPKISQAVAARPLGKTDLSFISGALITFVLSMLFSAGLVGISSALLDKWGSGVERTRRALNDAQVRLEQAKVARQALLDFQQAFEQLRARGLVGEEKRLDLIEHIQHIQAGRKLLPLTYAFAAQKPFAVDPAVMSGAMELRGTQVTLRMPLLHEIDLLHMLTDLKSKGLYTTQSCELTRVKGVQDPVAPQLQAECSLYWLTIGERQPGAGAPAPAPAPGAPRTPTFQ